MKKEKEKSRLIIPLSYHHVPCHLVIPLYYLFVWHVSSSLPQVSLVYFSFVWHVSSSHCHPFVSIPLVWHASLSHLPIFIQLYHFWVSIVHLVGMHTYNHVPFIYWGKVEIIYHYHFVWALVICSVGMHAYGHLYLYLLGQSRGHYLLSFLFLSFVFFHS